MVGDKDVWNTITTSVVDACIRLHGHVNWLTAAPSINEHCSPEYSRCCTARHTPVTTGTLKMHDLKMTDKILANSWQNYVVWKMQEYKSS